MKKQLYTIRYCRCCDKVIPPERRPHSTFCSKQCYRILNKRIYRVKHLDYFKRKSEQYSAENKLATKKRYAAKTDKRSQAIALGYRSWFEVEVAKKLDDRKLKYEYEPLIMKYVIEGKYKPDFVFKNNSGKTVIVECKGYLDPVAKRKMRAVKKSNPEADIRLVFQSRTEANIKWAEKNGFKWAIGEIDPEWWE